MTTLPRSSRLNTRPRRSRLLGTATIVLSAISLSACASGGNSSTPSPFDASQEADNRIRIEVENLNFNDVTIWAVRSGQRIRVGRMGGKADSVFRFTMDVAQPIHFEVEIISQGSCRTNSVLAQPGYRIWLLIPGDVNIAGRCRAELR